MKKKITLLFFTLFVSVIYAQVTKKVNVTTAGTLSTLLTATEKLTVSDLTVTGNINVSDFCFMRQMPQLTLVDITLVSINEFSAMGSNWCDQDGYYPANETPSIAFSNTGQLLKKILLPQNITSIATGGFTWTTKLESIVIPSSVTTIGLNSFSYSTSLKSIIFLGSKPPVIGSSISDHICFNKTSDKYDVPDIYVPYGSLDAYKKESTWEYLVNKLYEAILRATTQSATSLTNTSSTLNGRLEFISNTPVTAYGFCWNTTGSPTITDSKVDNGSITTIGAYSNSVSGLSQGTKYFVKAYATDGERTVYGNEVSFTTVSLPLAAGSISGLQTVCQGLNNVIYTVPPINNATSYIWTLPNGVTGTSTTNSITVNYSNTFISGDISVKGHNSWGDGNTSTLTITSNLLPANAGIISGNTSVCQGESSVIYTVPLIDNATSYTWTLPTGAIGVSTTNSISVNYSNTAISGNITVKGHNNCGDGVLYSLPVTVNKLPIISSTNKSIICGGWVLLNPTVNYSGSGTLKYKWIPVTGLDNDAIANPTATVTSDITYTLTVTSPNGCLATSDIKVIVNPLTVNAGTDKSIVCGGSTILSSVITNYTGSGTLKYKWTPSTGLDNDAIANPTATVTSDITYTVTVTTPNGCSASDDIKVIVNPLTVNAGTDKSIVCGGSILFSSVITNYTGSGTLKYKWTPSTGLDDDAISNPTVSAVKNIIYTVTVTTPNGCSASDNLSVEIIPMPKPEIAIVGVNSSNKNIVVWNKPVSKGIESYNIYRETNVSNTYEKIGDVLYDSLSVFVDNLSNAAVKSNKYKISILDRSGLESPISNLHKTIHLSINKGQNNTWNLIWEPYEGFAVPTYNIYRGSISNNLSFLDAVSGGSTQYSDISAPTGDVYYQLEVISSTLVDPTKVPSLLKKTKEYENTTMVSYNSSRSNIASNVMNAVNDIVENNNIIIYPNPVKNVLNIDFENGLSFEIINTFGQIIYSGNLNNKTTIETTNFSSGVYLIKLKTKKNFVYKKIIKE